MTRLQAFLNKIVWFWAGITWKGKFVGTALRDWTIDGGARFAAKVLENIEQDFMSRLTPFVDEATRNLEAADPDKPHEAEAKAKLRSALGPILDEVKSPSAQVAAFFGQSIGGGAVGGLISSTLGPYLKLLEYSLLRGIETMRFDPQTALSLRFRMPEKWEKLYGDLNDQGWSDERIEMFKSAFKMLLQADELTQYTIRFQMTAGANPAPTGDYIQGMYKLGYEPDEAERYFQQFLFYPSPADLIHWQAKEVFEPDMASRYGLDAEGERVERDAFYRAGMTDEQINNYWRAHWEHASWDQVTDMLHRGLLTPAGAASGIPTNRGEWKTRDAQGEEALYDYYRLVEIPPFWRSLLTQVSFRPLTRVDIRRMHKLGVLDLDQLYSAYRTHGYNDANAQLMTDWTVAYNKGSATEADRALSKTDILRMYQDRVLSEREATDSLVDMGYGEEEISDLLALYASGTDLSTREYTLTQVRTLYQQGLRTKGECTGFLAALGYGADHITGLYELWDWEAPAKTARPTRAQLDNFVGAGTIDLATWSAEYTALGYDMKYQEWYYSYLITTGEYPPA